MPRSRTVALNTLGCARNDVDSDELAGRLAAEGWQLVDDESQAEVVLVNTCGFVAEAKKDSIDALLASADLKESGRVRAVVAVGCLAERYGEQLAAALPEADAVLSFDDYPDIAARLRTILAGTPHRAHAPRDRRTLLPIAPTARRAGRHIHVPGFRATGAFIRARRGGGPVAPLKIASGCDRRCAFCAIPRFRGSFISRPPEDILEEAGWLASEGVREVLLVSENSTSYGKDLGDIRLLESLLPQLAAVDGIAWIRVSYLQPAELRPGLIDVMTSTPGVVPYFDLSFQHASGPVLRRMRRFGDAERFLDLLASIRQRRPEAGVRTNVIVGFPGETEDDVAELERFLTAARLDAVGVFGYSDEDGTEAADLDGKLDEATIRERAERISTLVDELMAQRAEDRVGETVEVLVESTSSDRAEGRSAHQAPEVDGSTTVQDLDGSEVRVGSIVTARVVATDGIDLVAVPVANSAGDPSRTGARGGV